MSHPADNLIAAWLHDELDAQGVKELEDYLRRDSHACARFARFCQSEVVMTQALARAEERPGTSGERATARSSRRLRVRRSPPRMNWAIPFAAAAAMIAAVILLTVVGRGPGPVAVPTVAKPSVPKAEQGPLVLLRSDGDVRYAGKPLSSGMQVPRGAVVEVLSGTADLRWLSDGSRLTLGSGSALRIDDGAAKIHLKRGRLDAHISQQVGTPFTISGPHAMTVVMGTRFSLQITDAVTDLHVSEGRVKFIGVADRTAIEVTASHSAQAEVSGLRLPSDEYVLGFVPTTDDISHTFDGRMIGRGTLRLKDLRKDRFNLRIECRAGVRSLSIAIQGGGRRHEIEPPFHLNSTTIPHEGLLLKPRVGTFVIIAQPLGNQQEHLGKPTAFELTIVP